MSDPLSQAISQAVDAALDARLPAIVESLKSFVGTPQEQYREDRFVPMSKLLDILGADRSTIIRRAKRGDYPRLRKHGQNLGYYQSDLDQIFEK